MDDRELPDTVDSLDDEMNRGQYHYPPGLMPDSEYEFASAGHDSELKIYQVSSPDSHFIRSDTYRHIHQ
ncbi:hypothetical protein OB919_20040 [Halobacteria archaeon AArc-curdl1]|uniref:Uncharacterized protein n=1 Tax=Natronosalvus hydrolyticus TaxID=2979988 RepID=A0AAP3E8T9_9EURY|nr:hypothetical protein [Halobacteria archaeon AArc-curdl1]